MKDFKTIYNERIVQLSNNISAADKLHAIKTVPISQPTLDKYLKGNLVKLDTAAKLIEVLTERVNDRYKDMKAAKIA